MQTQVGLGPNSTLLAPWGLSWAWEAAAEKGPLRASVNPPGIAARPVCTVTSACSPALPVLSP